MPALAVHTNIGILQTIYCFGWQRHHLIRCDRDMAMVGRNHKCYILILQAVPKPFQLGIKALQDLTHLSILNAQRVHVLVRVSGVDITVRPRSLLLRLAHFRQYGVNTSSERFNCHLHTFRLPERVQRGFRYGRSICRVGSLGPVCEAGALVSTDVVHSSLALLGCHPWPNNKEVLICETKLLGGSVAPHVCDLFVEYLQLHQWNWLAWILTAFLVPQVPPRLSMLPRPHPSGKCCQCCWRR
mmetsp:Transcript_43811/g.103582  ORF Transcript_43811/g.103582 Transcript_43811/m.103582 type:complete len:242 (+) Transcript_43811:509-1234(+)